MIKTGKHLLLNGTDSFLAVDGRMSIYYDFLRKSLDGRILIFLLLPCLISGIYFGRYIPAGDYFHYVAVFEEIARYKWIPDYSFRIYFGWPFIRFHHKLFFYIGFPFTLLFNPRTALFITVLFVYFLCGFSAYIITYYITRNKNQSIFSAIIYMSFQPLIFDLFYRCSESEATAYIFMPAVTYLSYLFIEDDKNPKTRILLAVVMSLLFMSHKLLLYIYIITFVIYLLFLGRIRKIFILSIVLLLSLFLIGFNTFPVFLELPLIRGYNPGQYLSSYRYPLTKAMPFINKSSVPFIYVGLLTAIFTVCGYWQSKKGSFEKTLIFFTISGFVYTYFGNYFFFLGPLQFPYRAIILSAPGVAYFLSVIFSARNKVGIIAKLICLLVIADNIHYFYFFDAGVPLENAGLDIYSDRVDIRAFSGFQFHQRYNVTQYYWYIMQETRPEFTPLVIPADFILYNRTVAENYLARLGIESFEIQYNKNYEKLLIEELYSDFQQESNYFRVKIDSPEPLISEYLPLIGDNKMKAVNICDSVKLVDFYKRFFCKKPVLINYNLYGYDDGDINSLKYLYYIRRIYYYVLSYFSGYEHLKDITYLYTLPQSYGRGTCNLTIESIRYYHDRVVFETDQHRDCLVEIKFIAYPGIHIYVDGMEKRYRLSEQLNFPVISLPAGRHKIVIIYRKPPLLYIGYVLSLIAVIFIYRYGKKGVNIWFSG